MNKKIFLILIIVFLLLPTAVSAKRELNGDQLELQETDAGQVIMAAGNVELIYDQLRVTAEDEGIYRRFNGEIEFRKNVKFYYQKYQGQAVELTGNLKTETIHLISEAQLKGPKSYLEADRIDLYQAEQRAEVKGNVYLEYNDFWAKSDQLTYYLEKELIELKGNVSGERNGESFEADFVQIDQQTEEIELQGKAKLVLPAAAVEDSDSTSESKAEAAADDN